MNKLLAAIPGLLVFAGGIVMLALKMDPTISTVVIMAGLGGAGLGAKFLPKKPAPEPDVKAKLKDGK